MALLAGIYEKVLYIVILVLIISHSFGKKTDSDCERRTSGCCEGFRFDGVLTKCVECKVGFSGTNCSLPCPFNSYGRGCQKLCICTEEACNFITGCENQEFGNETTMESSETTNREMGEKTKFSIRDLFKYVLIGLSSLLGLVLIMYIWLLLYQKKKNERQYIY